MMPAVVRRAVFATAVALLLTSRAAHAQQQQGSGNKQVINRPGAPAGVLSPAVRVGDLLFLSGVMGTKPGGGGLVDGGIEDQTRQGLENVKASLGLAGATMADVAKCTVFLTDAANFQSMNQVYREFFPTDPPARSTVAARTRSREAYLVLLALGARSLALARPQPQRATRTRNPA